MGCGPMLDRAVPLLAAAPASMQQTQAHRDIPQLPGDTLHSLPPPRLPGRHPCSDFANRPPTPFMALFPPAEQAPSIWYFIHTLCLLSHLYPGAFQ